MKGDSGTLLTLAANFALMSLFAVGGANAALPEMHRLAVEVMGWMTDQQFASGMQIANRALAWFQNHWQTNTNKNRRNSNGIRR